MSDLCDKPSSIRPGEELDLVKLEPFLRRQFPMEAGSLEVLQFPSGHSNLTYSIRLGQKQLVLRRPPFGSQVRSAHDMNREFRVLSKLHAAYAPAPKVFTFCDDDSVLGAPFYVMEPIRGIILRQDPPPGLTFDAHIAGRLGHSFLDNLADLHALDYAAIGLGDLGKPHGYLERQVHGWIERYQAAKTHDIPQAARLAQWMAENMPPQGGAALIHNDYKFDNVVLDPHDLPRVIGVLDWEMCTIGDPVSDLGTALAYWVDVGDPDELQRVRWGPTNHPGSPTRGELVERYARRTGRDVSRIAFYLVFGRFKLAVIVQQIYLRFHTGLTKDARFASMPELFESLFEAAWRSAQSGFI
jgi:aminoglycoside phosphotransferase (APT) family kinase protein